MKIASFDINARSFQNGNLQTNDRGGASHLKEARSDIKIIIENQTSLEDRLNKKVKDPLRSR